jgi:hypothetical protein
VTSSQLNPDVEHEPDFPSDAAQPVGQAGF